MAISAVPDLDLDGYNDVVVGAPLEDKGKGVIYIYNGENKALNKQFSQVRRNIGLWLTEKALSFGVFLFSTKYSVSLDEYIICSRKSLAPNWILSCSILEGP